MATFHLISHTHWDREWYLPYQVFRLRLVQLVDRLLVLLQTDPRFKHFMLDGQTIVLDDYLAMRPEREAQIRAYVRSGRLLIGPWHVLPDEFLVSPEATVRNLLEGARSARRFGRRMDVGYVPDPFGHIGQMPQVLRGFGMASASVQRGLSDEPCEFWWQAPDGSRVLMAYLREGYGNAAGLPTADRERFTAEVRRLGELLLAHSAGTNVALMHGTDHMEPPADTAAAIAYASSHLRPDRIKHSTLPEYLAALRRELGSAAAALPVVQGELRSPKRSHLLPAVLSTRMWIKQRNHHCENLLERWAEPFSTWAAWQAPKRRETAEPSQESGVGRNPAPLIREAWRMLMECHPHDSICGSSIDQVHEEMRPRFDQVEQLAEAITAQSLATLAQSIDGRSATGSAGAVGAVVVFNAADGPRTDLVQVALELPPEVEGFGLVDASGQPVPQSVAGRGNQELIHLSLERDSFRSAIGMVSEGRVSGMVVRQLSIERAGEEVRIQAVLSQSGTPNREAWARGVRDIERFLTDPSVRLFTVRARTAEQATVSFVARDVPPYGYRTYWIQPGVPRAPGGPALLRLGRWVRWAMPVLHLLSRLPVGEAGLPRDGGRAGERGRRARRPYRIENGVFRVEASPRDGSLTVLDKRSGIRFERLNQFVDGGDVGDEYNYCPPAVDTLVRRGRVRGVVIEGDEVEQHMRLRLALCIPQQAAPDRKGRAARRLRLEIEVEVALVAGVERVDVRTRVTNPARDHRLRVHFPAPIAVDRAEYDGHFEVVTRGLGMPEFDGTWVERPVPEKPQRRWTDISDGRVGLMIANRGLPEVEVMRAQGGSEIALTLLRCVGWLSRDDLTTRRGHAGPAVATPGAQLLGEHTFEYAIIPHAGTWVEAYPLAYQFDLPLRGLAVAGLQGTLAPVGSMLRVEGGPFVISAVKECESGGGVLVRGYNPSAAECSVHLRPWRRFDSCVRGRLDERPSARLKVTREGGVELRVRPHEVVTVIFRAEDDTRRKRARAVRAISRKAEARSGRTRGSRPRR